MNEYLSFYLLVITSFFTLINPFGSMSILMGLTVDMNQETRAKIVKRAVFAALIIILAFAFTGQFLFKFFNISVDSLRIVGGVIFFFMGLDMLNAKLSAIKMQDSDIQKTIKDIAITPLAIPLLCGPGAITNAIVLMRDAEGFDMKAVFIAGVITVLAITYIVLISSSKLMKIMGQTGINVMMRLMGLIIMVIAVEFFISGVEPVVLRIGAKLMG